MIQASRIYILERGLNVEVSAAWSREVPVVDVCDLSHQGFYILGFLAGHTELCHVRVKTHRL